MSGSSELQHAHQIALDASPSGVVICDLEERILYANPQIETLFGYASEELAGASVDLLLPEASRSNHNGERVRFWSDALSASMGAGRELLGRRKDGSEVPVEIGLSLATHNGCRVVIASVVDVTERRELQRRAQRAVVERLSFEQLLSNLVARFVNLAIEEVDEAIIDSQHQVVEALDIDRSALWQFSGKTDDVPLSHGWRRPEFAPPPASLSAGESFPWILSRIRANEAVWIESVERMTAPVDRKSLKRLGTKATAVLPLTQDNRVVAALAFGSLRTERAWDSAIQEHLRLVAAVFAQALARKQSEEQLRKALAEVERLRDQLALENQQLRNEVKSLTGLKTIAAESRAIRDVMAQVEPVARTSATVLILGETGCGKEVLAQAIHDASDRRGRPMVRVSCAAIPTALIESELFGRERGAYTGALSRQVGRFEQADGSTLFLDEVGELPLEAQVKLLRFLQDKVIERLGNGRPIKVDVRIIAATNRDLSRAVADRTFREDLFYRLNVFPITVPPLRERLEDIPALVGEFIDEFSRAFGKRIDPVSREDLAALQRHSWPGNVRELRNLIERSVIVASGKRLRIDLPQSSMNGDHERLTLREFEAHHIRAILNSVGWRVRGPGGAAELLGLKPTTLDNRMAKLGIRRPSTATVLGDRSPSVHVPTNGHGLRGLASSHDADERGTPRVSVGNPARP